MQFHGFKYYLCSKDSCTGISWPDFPCKIQTSIPKEWLDIFTWVFKSHLKISSAKLVFSSTSARPSAITAWVDGSFTILMGRVALSLSHSLHFNCQEIFSALLSKYTQNLTSNLFSLAPWLLPWSKLTPLLTCITAVDFLFVPSVPNPEARVVLLKPGWGHVTPLLKTPFYSRSKPKFFLGPTRWSIPPSPLPLWLPICLPLAR